MKRRARGYWKDWRHVVGALLPLVQKLGHMPTQEELRRNGLSSVSRALRDFHGGHRAAARKLGVPTKREHRSLTLKDRIRFAWEVSLYSAKGYFPSMKELIAQGRGDIVSAIKNHHGGFRSAARMLNLLTYSEYHRIHGPGYWSEERIIDEYLTFIMKYKFTHWPTPGDIRAKGHGPLARAILKMKYSRVREILAASGLDLGKKKRSIAHLKPFEQVFPVNPEVFEEGELKYYFVGVVEADGCLTIRRNEHAVEIALNKADEDLLIALRDRISPGRPIHLKPNRKNRESDAVRLKINSRELVEMLGQYMPLHRKTWLMTFPESIPDDFFAHFLRGVIDGDGSIGITRNRKVFFGELRYYHVIRVRILGTKAFLEGLVARIQKLLGIKGVKVAKRTGENVFEVQYSGNHARRILEYIYDYCTIFLKRKLRVWQLLKDLSQAELARRYNTPMGRYNRNMKQEQSDHASTLL
ncbi:MAG TPA: LAGLIDADG family homing endonuclease [Spirochaetota bacterium]|nr:LAGLIDADG family homing endonuclease [Spirochaetota bacterium]